MRGRQTCEAHVSACDVKLLRGAAIVLPIGRDDPQRASLRFIAFEGADGAGKTTQARLLAAHLRALGREVVEVREPGGTPAGEVVRALLLDSDGAARRAAPRRCSSRLRARSSSRTSIAPALARGATVIADRYVGSSLVYQGVVRGVGAEDVRTINDDRHRRPAARRHRAARRHGRAGGRAARARRRRPHRARADRVPPQRDRRLRRRAGRGQRPPRARRRHRRRRRRSPRACARRSGL